VSSEAESDTLSDVLREVRLSGALFFDVEGRPPWVADAPAARDIAAFVMPGSQHVIAYHVVARGSCWVELGDEDSSPIRLEAGSVVLFPQGDPHVLSSEPGMRAGFDPKILEQPRPEDITPFLLTQNSDGPDSVRLICGFLGCDELPFNPLLQALPKMLVVADGYRADGGWLRSLIEASVDEIRRSRTGGRNVLSRLSELIFIEAVRNHAEALSPDAVGWLAALRDPVIGRSIGLLHEEPARAWTLATLARAAGVSRTVLAQQFKDSVGMTAMAYLASWRMQIASGLMARGDSTIARIASEVGYGSEAAFSRAFKRCTGLSPRAWQDSHQA
jgi:AraC-like DNA-binding protein